MVSALGGDAAFAKSWESGPLEIVFESFADSVAIMVHSVKSSVRIRYISVLVPERPFWAPLSDTVLDCQGLPQGLRSGNVTGVDKRR